MEMSTQQITRSRHGDKCYPSYEGWHLCRHTNLEEGIWVLLIALICILVGATPPLFAQSEEPHRFDVYAFCENPFVENTFVPELKVESQSELVKESKKFFDIKVEKVEKRIWPNGYYIRTTLISPQFTTIYVGADGPGKARYRVSLSVNRPGVQMKHHIFTGMMMADLFKILAPLHPERAKTPSEAYNIWDDGGVMLVRFKADGDRLGSVEFFTSDK